MLNLHEPSEQYLQFYETFYQANYVFFTGLNRDITDSLADSQQAAMFKAVLTSMISDWVLGVFREGTELSATRGRKKGIELMYVPCMCIFLKLKTSVSSKTHSTVLDRP